VSTPSLRALLEDHEHAQLLVADELVLGARRHEDGIAFGEVVALS
jgi:hypothetical protein